MRILSIETSCDETAISIIEAKGGIKKASFKILSNNIASQINIHQPYGGVVPMLAKREHIKNLPIILGKTLKDSKLKLPQIDLIAVTVGPGLEPALWTGIVFAEELSKKYKIPLMPVNHMEGHFFSVLIPEKKNPKSEFLISKKIQFPALALLVSGGHTELILIKGWLKYKKIGQTRDDAAGEAFDKVARLLGLPYPGGPEISRLAQEARALRSQGSSQADGPRKEIFQQENIRALDMQSSNLALPRPMLKTPDFDFSFSGLKTAVLYKIRDIESEIALNHSVKNDRANQLPEWKLVLAREFEDAVVEVLVYKTMKAAMKYKIKTLIVAGGVAANKRLREIFEAEAKKAKIKLLFPARELATDNSLMIALTAYFQYSGNPSTALRVNKKAPRINLRALGNLEL